MEVAENSNNGGALQLEEEDEEDGPNVLQICPRMKEEEDRFPL